MSKKGAVPDAWDDNWESAADKVARAAEQTAPAPARISRAERRAQHAEANRQLWDSAEQPQRFHFLDTKGDLPMKDEFKPAVKVLSRKPAPSIASRAGATNGIAGLSLEDEDDSEEEARKKSEASFKERQRKAQLEREEKQRKYAEVRERLFGGGKSSSRDSSESRSTSAKGAASSETRTMSAKNKTYGARDSQHSSSTDHSPARTANQPKQLYDPSYTIKPRRVDGTESSRPLTPREDVPIRMPRGPDGSGRGGFGFAARGGHS